MGTVRIGGAEVEVSEGEYAIACLEPETPIEWSGNPFEPKSGVGIFKYSMAYDGIQGMAESGGKRVHLHACARGFSVKVLNDVSRLNESGMHGEAI